MSLWSRLERRLGDLASELVLDEYRDQLNQARHLLAHGDAAAAKRADERPHVGPRAADQERLHNLAIPEHHRDRHAVRARPRVLDAEDDEPVRSALGVLQLTAQIDNVVVTP